jgi:hypothetical protein
MARGRSITKVVSGCVAATARMTSSACALVVHIAGRAKRFFDIEPVVEIEIERGSRDMDEAAHPVRDCGMREARGGEHIGCVKVGPCAPWRRQRRAMPHRIDTLQQRLQIGAGGAGEVERHERHAERLQRLAGRAITAGGAYAAALLRKKRGGVAAKPASGAGDEGGHADRLRGVCPIFLRKRCWLESSSA